MRTRVVDPQKPAREALAEAAAVLRSGGLVAFPTETVYGLGASALDPEAVERIFAAKGRPADNPLILHVARFEQVAGLARSVPQVAADLARAFWPGPLTLVLPRAERVPPVASGGLDTVAVRIPRHPVALGLLSEAGLPVAAPSANRSGRPSPTLAAHVAEDLAGEVDLLLDGGATGIGVESTVLDLTRQPYTVLRAGSTTVEELEAVLGRVAVHPSAQGEPAAAGTGSPGTRHTHYAPRVPAFLVEGEGETLVGAVQALADREAARGRRVGILAGTEHAGRYRAHVVRPLGSRSRPEEAARNLYRALRELEGEGVHVILLEGWPARGLGLALRDRMRRACGQRVIRVGPH